jgi:hypothetical protein
VLHHPLLEHHFITAAVEAAAQEVVVVALEVMVAAVRELPLATQQPAEQITKVAAVVDAVAALIVVA